MNNWTDRTFTLRTRGDDKRFGYSPSAPDELELKAYVESIGNPKSSHEILVMGMTAGLRESILSAGHRVTCIDNSPDAVSFLSGAVTHCNAEHETILLCDWKEMSSIQPQQFSAVVGDGVFGVLPVDEVPIVLDEIRNIIAADGVMITRMLLIPRDFNFEDNTQDRLIEKYRCGEIRVEAFAMGMRLWANFDEFYDAKAQRFRNEKSFHRLKEIADEGILTEEEYRHITCRYYGGDNYLPYQDEWETLVDNSGFQCTKVELSEAQDWYQYFPIYLLRSK